jgi:hypothetical protein
MVDRVSSCSKGEEGESAECGRASAGYGRVSLECSSMISFCRRVSDCEEPESEELEGAEEGDIVKIWIACSM